MKTYNSTKKQLKALRFLFLLISVCCFTGGIMAQEIEETIVFEDNFNRTSLSPGGAPEVDYTITKTGTASPGISGNMLRLPNVASQEARSTITAPMTSYATPFNPILESIDADSLVWTFNIRQNYNGRLTGIEDGTSTGTSRGITAILAASSSDLSIANGYAIANGGAAPINYRFVKFSGGLATASNITKIQDGQTLADNRSYISIKVVFIPSTKTWKFYDRLDAGTSGPFLSPTDETIPYILAGSFEEDTYTNTELNTFGFTHKYYGSADFFMFVDNFRVTAYKTTGGTGLQTSESQNLQVYSPGNNQIAVKVGTAESGLKLVVYNMTGQKLSEQPLIVGTTVVNRTFAPGIYLMKAGNETKKVMVK